MPRKFLKEFRDGEAVDEVFLLADKQLRANRNADLYLLASLRDKTGLVNGLMWNVTEESVSHISTGNFVRVRGKVQLYQGGLQIIVTHIDLVVANSVDPSDFHPERNQDVEPMLNRVREILTGIDDPQLRSLMECFLIDETLMQSFSLAPAGIKAHHAYEGGLLEHTLNMMEVALRIADLYPKADIGLILAGIFLHDLGKIRELGYEASFIHLYRRRSVARPYDHRGGIVDHQNRGNRETFRRTFSVRNDSTPETHYLKPPWHIRVWKSPTADDAGSRHRALSR